MSKLFSFFIFLFFIKLILSEKQDFKCGPLTNKLKIGDEVILCIHVLNSQHKKFAIPIKIDEYINLLKIFLMIIIMLIILIIVII